MLSRGSLLMIVTILSLVLVMGGIMAIVCAVAWASPSLVGFGGVSALVGTGGSLLVAPILAMGSRTDW